jgi:histidyl-tRNA synthetase
MADKVSTPSIQALRGMKDVLPSETRYFQFVENKARELFEMYNYREIRTPLLEATELFARTVGEASDIVVSKQMYTFTDPGDRSNTLRPEGTAGVVRALIEAGRFKETSQQKVYYFGPMFRYEKPQKGRLRQFTQHGVEFFGVAHPAADAEVITLCDNYLRYLGFTEVTTKLNNVGCRECRRDYNTKLREAILGDAHLRKGASTPNNSAWCEDCVRRAEINPMRVFDCKLEECRALVATLPRVSDFVCEACRAHFDTLRRLLDATGVPYEIDPELVRGLDYYTRTVFEVVQGGLGSQNAVLGGGRYDYLVEDLGGPPTPAVGMSVGIERLILAMQASEIGLPAERQNEFYILALDEESLVAATKLVQCARDAGVQVHYDCQPRSAKAGLKAANRSGALVAIIIGADELARNVAQWKNLQSGEQMELPLTEIERNLASG